MNSSRHKSRHVVATYFELIDYYDLLRHESGDSVQVAGIVYPINGNLGQKVGHGVQA
jgi:hypothetical protein